MRKIIPALLIISSSITAQHADVFFTVHCEPHNDSLFYKLTELVNLADNYNIPLTIELTPQWAERINNSAPELNLIRTWQLNGHEIGAHHHGVEAGNGWDGYTDHPPDDWPNPERHLGNMNDYMNILNLAGGDSTVLTGGFGDTLDWPQGMTYRTMGHALDDAVSQPETEINNGQSAWLIGYSVVFDTLKANLLTSLYTTTTPDEIFGIVTHVFNFRDDELYLRMLFEFFQDKNCCTVRSIMRNRGLVLSTREISNSLPGKFILSQNYPNPFNPTTTIKYSIPEVVNGEGSKVKMIIYDLLGKEVATLVNEHQRPGNYEVRWEAANMPSGVYFYRLRSGNFTDTRKMILLR